MCQDLAQEKLGSVMLGIIKKLMRVILFDNLTFIHKNYPVCDSFCEAHLMADDKHSHTGIGKLNHDIEDFFDHLRVQR